MPVNLDWLRQEAAAQKLPMSEEDVIAVAKLLEKTKMDMARLNVPDELGVEPAFRFRPGEI